MIEILEDRFVKTQHLSPTQTSPTQHLSPTLSCQEREQATSIQIFQQDILKFIPEFKNYSVIANIPYYITSPILHHFLYDIENIPEKMVILMQKDVGDKILARTSSHKTSPSAPLLTGEGSKRKSKSSVLSLMIAKKCYAEEKLCVPKECFVPAPKIESSVLLFELHKHYRDIDDE